LGLVYGGSGFSNEVRRKKKREESPRSKENRNEGVGGEKNANYRFSSYESKRDNESSGKRERV